MAATKPERIAIENFTSPGHVVQVDRAKYMAMRKAMLDVLPHAAPGMTADEMKQALLPLLPETHFPGGAKAGWWMKAVQLDLEAKRMVEREKSRPLRFHQLKAE